jgi:hypothetical protein
MAGSPLLVDGTISTVPDIVALLEVVVPAVVSLLVPVVAHFVSGRRRRQARLLAEIAEIATIAEKLPEGPARSAWLALAERMAGTYESSVIARERVQRDPAGIVLGFSFTAGGLYLIIQTTAGSLPNGWLWLAIPLLALGLFGTAYEGSGGKKAREGAPESKPALSETEGPTPGLPPENDRK